MTRNLSKLEPLSEYALGRELARRRDVCEFWSQRTGRDLRDIVSPARGASECERNVLARLLKAKIVGSVVMGRVEHLAALQSRYERLQQPLAPSEPDSAKKNEPDASTYRQSTLDPEPETIERTGHQEGAKATEPALPTSQPDVPEDDDVGGTDVEENGIGADSMFLPSLAHGYLAGATNAEDGEAEREYKQLQKKERKNRRGQRARQAIWEAKYGKKANHVRKQRESEQQEREEALRRKEARRARNTRDRVGRTHDEAFTQPVRHQSEAAIHPSWQARKAQPEVTAWAGKKVVF